MDTGNLITLLGATFIAAVAPYVWSRIRPDHILSREENLEAEVARLRETVRENEQKMAEQTQQISVLQRLLGEAQLRIAAMQEELTYLNRVRGEMEASIRAWGQKPSQ